MKQDNPQRMGPRGNCVCPKCGHLQPHHRGIPCQEERCEKCGGKLLREGSPDHQRVREALNKKKESE